jgi:hypothetical protein
VHVSSASTDPLFLARQMLLTSFWERSCEDPLVAGAIMTRQLPISIAALYTFVAGPVGPLTAQPPQGWGPCGQVTAACKAAGFTLGSASAGTGLQADCVIPVMQGIAQPAAAARPLPQVAAQVVAACKASNPRFGQGPTSAARKAPPTVTPMAPNTNAAAALNSINARSTGTDNTMGAPSHNELVAPTNPDALTAGTGSFAVVIDETPVGNATAVTIPSTVDGQRHGIAVVLFAADDQQTRPVETCFAQKCIIRLMTITQTRRSLTGKPAPLPTYNLTTATVSYFERKCAGPYTGQPCAGLATFAYQEIDVEYPPTGTSR